MPMNQPRLSSEDWDSIRHLLNQQSHHLLQTFTNHSHSQHILAQRPIPSCQSLIAEKQTTVQLSHLIVQQLSAVQLTDLTVNPNLDLISILLRFQNPTLSAHFKYQMNASIDRNDIFNQSYDLLASGRVSLQASDWKLAVFAQLHHFDNDAQRVYLRDVELRSFISPDRLHSTLSINQTSSPITQTQIGAIRSALSDCMSEQLRVLLEARVAQYIKSHLLCNPTTSAQCPPLESPALSFAQHLNGKPYRPSIAFYTHDLEHVLRLNATTLSAFHNHQNLSESVLPPDLAKRLTEEEQRGSIPSEPLFEPNVRQQFDQQLEQLLNKALLDMNAPSFADAALDDEWKASAVSEPEPDETDADESEVSESDPLNRSKRQVPCERGQELDEYVDSLFRFASRIVRAMEPFALPNATIDLPEYNMKLFLHHGGATRAYTLTRKRAAWVYCTNESVSLGTDILFSSFK